jgi:hypothetical protein
MFNNSATVRYSTSRIREILLYFERNGVVQIEKDSNKSTCVDDMNLAKQCTAYEDDMNHAKQCTAYVDDMKLAKQCTA